MKTICGFSATQTTTTAAQDPHPPPKKGLMKKLFKKGSSGRSRSSPSTSALRGGDGRKELPAAADPPDPRRETERPSSNSSEETAAEKQRARALAAAAGRVAPGAGAVQGSPNGAPAVAPAGDGPASAASANGPTCAVSANGPNVTQRCSSTTNSHGHSSSHIRVAGRGESKISIFEDPALVMAYDTIPVMELTELPRGGVSMETQAVGRVQFGIPPETIKDSMRLGLSVPSVYIVPVERFCREIGPALGVNLAEFEFPAYFNFFVQRKRCTLIVDSDEAEHNIRRVFSETLLGPDQFRREDDPIAFEEEDFDPDFPHEMIPNFEKEFRHFRIMPDGKELVLETLLKFRHFCGPSESGGHEGLGVPPKLMNGNDESRKKSEAKRKMRTGSLPPDVEDEEECTHPMRNSLSSPDIAGLIRSIEEADVKDERSQKPWTYSEAKWIGETGDVATVFPEEATPEEIATKKSKRVEIFKMPGGTEYILHDVDENNIIVGKARFSGNVQVPEFMEVDGFGGRDLMTEIAKRRKSLESRNSCHNSLSSMLSDEEDSDDEAENEFNEQFGKGGLLPPTFYPPSFGVTVLGNSHGFDKSGSTSGYVLWINGRGVMIDPPPYSSATLEREGIRPGTIVGIILTHCHADHDAGAFQKILTGLPVAVITTPTIYNSFIRKYAALSELNSSLLRHSHRYVPAIIGTPLRFQGATFHFTYTLHTIPCVGFRVEWRGRSMVFTGDHFNSPPAIDKLEETGVLSKARADDLRHLPLQETDLLLHEAGAPPIHTPLEVLMKLPPSVKKRLFVVHTSALPEGCQLRVAPTGTNGTIRLDEVKTSSGSSDRKPNAFHRTSIIPEDLPVENEVLFRSLLTQNEYEYGDTSKDTRMSCSHPSRGNRRSSFCSNNKEPPLVSLRPASSTDAWFILNLLSTVPFLCSLSYASTMDVLEVARVDAFCVNDVVVPVSRRRDVLCVIWEGTCMEREQSTQMSNKDNALVKMKKTGEFTSVLQVSQGRHAPLLENELNPKKRVGVWQAGDWTGPRSLQPEKRLSGESSASKTHDIVAMSEHGVKVITVEFSKLHAILRSGSALYRKYQARKCNQRKKIPIPAVVENTSTRQLMERAVESLNVMELIESNSALVKLNAVQKRHLECLAEGPVFYHPGECLWKSGSPVDKAFIIVTGAVSFVKRQMMEEDETPVREPVTAPDEAASSGQDRFASRVLGRLRSRRATAAGLVFSKGHFLCDISKMVAGLLTEASDDIIGLNRCGQQGECLPFQEVSIIEQNGDRYGHKSTHSSTLAAGKGGCVAMYFPKSSLTAFLDKYPGFLLSLLGTQVIV